MKKVELLSLTLINFKGQKELQIAFQGKQTTISADNGVGKSRIKDAFTWLLFGKDSHDRKDFEIFTIENGKSLEKVDAVVEGTIMVDGIPVTLKRVLHQIWQRPRGTSQEVYKGNETQLWINEVPKKVNEYNDYINSTLEDSIFKLLTNPAYFLFSKEMTWQVQRDILFDIAGTISDSDVLDKIATLKNKDQVLQLTNALNSGKSLIEFKKEIAGKKRKLREALETIQPRVDQTNKLMPEDDNWEKIQSEINEIESELISIDKQISNRSLLHSEKFKAEEAKRDQIRQLKISQRQVVEKAEEMASLEVKSANKNRTLFESSLDDIREDIVKLEKQKANAEKLISVTNESIDTLEKTAAGLRIEWTRENEMEFQAAAAYLVCPAYGHRCSDSHAMAQFAQKSESAKEVFNSAKLKRLDDINAKGAGIVAEIQGLKKVVQFSISELESISKSMESLKIKEKALSDDLSNTPKLGPKTIIASELREWQDLEKSIQALEKSINEVEPIDLSDYQNLKVELTSKRDELKKRLSNRDLILRYKKEIENLNKESARLVQQISDVENIEVTAAELTRLKITESENRINRLFGMVQFKLFGQTLDGNEFETCTPMNKLGVPIASTNTADQINAGLDIINTLSRFYNISAPIFIDNAESVNTFLPLNSQAIFLRVSNDKKLIISHN